MNSIHHLEKRDKDLDLHRILRLYDIIKRYELLVEYLLSDNDFIIPEQTYDEIIDAYTRRILRSALKESNGNVNVISKRLQMSHTTLDRYIKRLGLTDASTNKRKNNTSSEISIKASEAEMV